jgi:hypothetical protein
MHRNNKFTPQYQAGALLFEYNKSIVNNDINSVIAGLNQQKYENQGSLSWQLALENPKQVPEKGYFWHALDLFVIHKLPGLCPSRTSEAEIIAHLQTSAGRASMAETVGLCLVQDTHYGKKIIDLLNDKDSILYRGLHTHRFNSWSKSEPSTMAFIREECERARVTHALNHGI